MRRGPLLVAALLAVLGLAGCSGTAPAAAPAPPVVATSTPTPAPTPTASPTDEGPQPLPSTAAVDVTSLAIPAIGLKTGKLEELALLDDRTLAAPKDPDRAGWYAGGVVPGDAGPAVIAGHVDSKTGPAVFYDLGRVAQGDVITVGRSDGSSARFTVDAVVHTAKDAFPTDRVYGPTPDAQLRLITCSGPYVGERGYTDNTIVFATRAD